MRRGFNRVELVVVIAIIVVLCFLFLPFGRSWVFEIPVTLVFGWITYPFRVNEQVKPDPWTVLTATACLAFVTVGSHFFLRWLAGGAAHWSWKLTIRCVGLVVLMFVAGIAVVGIVHQASWLARSPEPWVKGYSEGRMYSANNLKQIDIAVLNYEEANKELPRSNFNATGQPMHSWQTALLPYIEQDSTYKQIDQKKSWNDPANAGMMERRIKVYMNPSFYEDNVNGLGISHYAGNAAIVLGDPKKLDSFSAGGAQTILAGEVSANFRAWGDPLNARDPRLGTFSGPNGRRAQFVMLDGTIRTFNPQELAEATKNW